MSRTPGTHELIVSAQADPKPVEHLRALNHLAVVGLDFTIHPDEAGTARSEFYKARAKKDLEVWKTYLVEVLKNSPSKERKFLRWRVYKGHRRRGTPREVQVVVEGELEVFPETSM